MIFFLFLAVPGLITASVVYMPGLRRKLRQSRLELEPAKSGLELEVKERTKELEALNHELRQEISERRRAEAQLLEAKQDWQNIFDAITDMITVHDADFNIIRSNKAAKDILKLSGEGAGAIKCYRHYHGASRPPEGCLSCKSLITHQPSDFIVFEKHLDRFLEFRAIPRFGAKGECTGLIHIVRDMTKWKEMEDAMKESEGRFRAIIESEPHCVALLDRDGCLIMMNPAGLAIIEADSFEQVKGSKVVNLLPPEYRKSFEDSLEKVFMGEPTVREFEITGFRGTKRSLMSHSVPFRNTEGGITGLLAITVDITEHRRIEEQLMHAQKMDAIGKLAGGIAHDFNNILSAITGYATLARGKLQSEDVLAGYMQHILQASERAAAMVKGLLAFSREEQISLGPVDLNEIIKGFEKLLLELIREDIELTINYSRTALAIKADTGQLERVLMNLAVNARDAMSNGGLLLIETREFRVDEKLAKIKNFSKPNFIKPGRYALLSVTDTGAGMDRQTQKKIFDPFFTTKEIGKGTGLGLSISYGIVEQHGGRIEVLSEPGSGTTFKIYLPLADLQVKTEKEAPQEDLLPGGGESILLAEDNLVLRNLTSTILTEHGYRVIEAENGEDAVTKFLANRDGIRVLIFDVIMPGKNGKEAYQEIKKSAPDIKAIFMSGYAGGIISGNDNGGETEFIQKPIPPAVLLKKVRELMDERLMAEKLKGLKISASGGDRDKSSG